MQNKRKLKRELLADGNIRLKKNIAILGGYTTNDIMLSLEIHLLRYGIEPTFYESEYGKYYEDAIFGNEELDAFHPDIVYVCTSNRNITQFPSLYMNESDVLDLLDSEYSRFENVWDAVMRKYNCPVIQNNFELPYTRLLGNMDATDIHGGVHFINALNARFAQYARAHDNFFINDVAYLSACYGLDAWSDPFYWHMYKYAVSVDAIPTLTYSVTNIIKALFGKNKKALVLDLDNTLWGGVIGDDGAEGIEIGQEGAMGQAYSEFQGFIRRHKELGVLLCVSSKNDPDNALAGLRHPDSVLSPDDFVVIKANWEPKSGNVADIADELNLLPESFVFVDDNPAEREIVSAQIAGIAAPELGRAEHYLRDIDRKGYFESVGVSDDDMKRGEMYVANAVRAKQAQTFANYEDYLKSLEMVAEIKPFDKLSIPRVTQLVNKSNQFNLTTKRYTQAEIEAVSLDSSYIGISGRLSDKFGDNGIVSVVIGRREPAADSPTSDSSDNSDSVTKDSLHIELWVMSCRVLKRDMEYAMMDTLVRLALDSGIGEIYGYYYPTAKNAMVKDFYRDMGFDLVSQGEGGDTVWRIDVLGCQEMNGVIGIR
jgi:FkbH-like protein